MNLEGLLFLTGSCAYPTLEMMWRGHTHYSMAIAGGACLCLIDKICCEKLSHKGMYAKCAAGAGIITGVELVTGLVVNELLHYNVWDYSNVPFNILGQVCLPYTLLWAFLSIPAMAICQLCRRANL